MYQVINWTLFIEVSSPCSSEDLTYVLSLHLRNTKKEDLIDTHLVVSVLNSIKDERHLPIDNIEHLSINGSYDNP